MSAVASLRRGFDSVRPIASLSLFYIAFLTTEHLLDGRVSEFLPADAVAVTHAAAAAVSLLGYALYVLVRMRIEGAGPLLHGVGTLAAFGALVASFAPSALSLFIADLATMLFLGFIGASACEALARRFADGPGIARVTGAAYGAAVVVQCLFEAVAPTPVVLALLVAVPAATAPVCATQCLEEDAVGLECPFADRDRERPGRAVALLAVLVALMTCVFSTLNVNLTSAHVQGLVGQGAWARLFLVVSAVVAGEVFDRLEHRWEPGLMAVVTTLASFAIFAVLQGAPMIVATVVFYLGSGFFVVFYTSAFMLVARETGRYALWSGMGRVVSGACSLLVAVPALVLVDERRALAETAVILAILAAMLAITFLVILGPRPEPALPQYDEDDAPQPAAPTSDERLAAFAAEFQLTEREAEVLQAMVTSRQSVQELARSLCLSRTAFYRHVSSMNGKTGTKNRVELMHFFFDWMPGAGGPSGHDAPGGTSDQRERN